LLTAIARSRGVVIKEILLVGAAETRPATVDTRVT